MESTGPQDMGVMIQAEGWHFMTHSFPVLDYPPYTPSKRRQYVRANG